MHHWLFLFICDNFKKKKINKEIKTSSYGLLTLLALLVERLAPGRPFLESPEDFSGAFRVTIVFVSSKRRRLEERNLAVILIFIPFTTCRKTSLTD